MGIDGDDTFYRNLTSRSFQDAPRNVNLYLCGSMGVETYFMSAS